MCEILKDNFEENFVLIENAIRKADFIGNYLFIWVYVFGAILA